jgi:glyoxylase-like metal-dependent hydrolase (beta-lactamase superfamily II)/ketosteroid isomerase-like protein
VLACLACTLLAPVSDAQPATAPGTAAGQAAAAVGPPQGFTTELVAPGVFALIRQKPPGFLSDCNVVFIVNDDDVVVVDTNLTPASAEASIAALRTMTSKPVRLVINTHWHVDHVSGNQVYRRAFPGVEFVGHRRVRDDLLAKGAENRRDMREQGRQFGETMRKQVEAGLSLAGTPLSETERASYAADLQLIDHLVAELPSVEIVPPSITVDNRLTLFRGSRRIDLLALGRSHTHGDIVVFLPAERVVVTGDLLVGPTPLVGADQSFVGEWAASLDRLLELDAQAYVPGHGPVYRDGTQARLLRDMLRAVEDHARGTLARGEPLDQARGGLNLDRFRDQMAGENQALRTLFAIYGKGPALTAAYRDDGRPLPVVPTVTLPPELDRVLRDYERAWQARDAAGLAALFDVDGFVLSNNRPAVRGRAAIQTHYASAGGPLALRAQAFAVDGTTGYIIGAWARVAGQADAGKFVLALRRAPDGRWLIAADIDNAVGL